MKLYALVKTFSLGDCLSVGLYRDEETAHQEMVNQLHGREQELGDDVHDISVEYRTAKVYYDGGSLADMWTIVPCEF